MVAGVGARGQKGSERFWVFLFSLGACPSNPLVPHELIVELKKMFVLQNTFHWIKSITVETRDHRQISTGHFKPLHSERFVNDCHEYVFHLTKTGNTKLDRLAVGVPYSDKSNIARWAHTRGRDLRCRGNNWFIPVPNDRESIKTTPASGHISCRTSNELHQDSRQDC